MRHFTSILKSALVAVCACATSASFAQALTGTTASTLASMIKVGWNLGNTLDATGYGLDAETSWFQPKTTQAMIDKVHEAGFNAVRIPVSWHTHVSNEGAYQFAINQQWMARVKEVVDYAYGRGMFVILNIHHDNENGYMMPTKASLNNSKKYVSEVWSQIATAFADYDQHLIFEIVNEPRLTNNQYEWWFDINNVPQEVKDAIDCINQINQAGLDAIRAAGGNNMDRLVGCPSYDASLDGAITAPFALPNDVAKDRLWLSVHAYTPYNFCMNKEIKDHVWNDNYSNDVAYLYNTLKLKFLDKGIPVYIGETSSSNYYNLQDRIKWEKCFFSYSKNYGIPCFMWDNNTIDNADAAERHGYLHRQTLEWYEPTLITTIMETLGVDVSASVNETLASTWTVYTEGNTINVKSESAISAVDVFAMTGARVASINAGAADECSVAVSSRGVYVVVVSNAEGKSAKKIIVK